MKRFFIALAVASFMFSCQEAPKQAGVYKGEFPCASCSAIDIELSLNPDMTFTLVKKMEGDEAPAETIEGKYTVDENGLVSLDSQEFPNKFNISETGEAVALNVDGEPIYTDASQYDLTTSGDVFFGTLPCADCPGYETTVIINKDQSYFISQQALESDSAREVKRGNFESGQNGILTLDAEDGFKKMKIEQGKLVILSNDEKPIEGPTAKFYTLPSVGRSFSGTLPCADCSGIETTLILGNDNTYSLEQKGIEKEENSTITKGNYTIDNNTVTLSGIKEGENFSKLLLSDGKARVLDSEGKEIKQLSTSYTLKKQN